MTITVGDTVRLAHPVPKPYDFSRAPWSGPLIVDHAFSDGSFWVLETIGPSNRREKPRRYGRVACAEPEDCVETEQAPDKPLHVLPAIL